MNRHGVLVLARGVFVVVALLSLSPAWAIKTITVDSVLDDVDDDLGDYVCHTAAGTCTLRAAVMQAVHNNSTVTDRVRVIVPAGTYFLSVPIANGGGPLDLNVAAVGDPVLEIAGAGAATTIIDANQLSTVVFVAYGRTALMSGVTLRNGKSLYVLGGGVGNEGNLTLESVVVSGNSCPHGGGIYNGGSLTINRSSIVANVAIGDSERLGDGGGILNDLSVIGGGLNISASTIAGNSAGYGGGISTYSKMVIVNSTIANNGADVDGGGIDSHATNSSYATNIYNSTIAFNDADQTRKFGGAGGGIVSTVTNTGIAPNIYNTIVAGNYVSNTPAADDCYGALSTHARNLFGSTAGCAITQVSGAYSYITADGLGPLQNNGGPTLTIALPDGSKAIDYGDPFNGCRDQNSAYITTDQRGFFRNDAACDVGAFELGAVNPNDSIFKSGFEVVP